MSESLPVPMGARAEIYGSPENDHAGCQCLTTLPLRGFKWIKFEFDMQEWSINGTTTRFGVPGPSPKASELPSNSFINKSLSALFSCQFHFSFPFPLSHLLHPSLPFFSVFASTHRGPLRAGNQPFGEFHSRFRMRGAALVSRRSYSWSCQC